VARLIEGQGAPAPSALTYDPFAPGSAERKAIEAILT
jgi:hypothetical protein